MPTLTARERLTAHLDDLDNTGDREWFRAPGRVNLMGDHTDYHDGLVLPMAIDLDCIAAVRRRDDDNVVIRSLDLQSTGVVAADGSNDPDGVMPEWARLVAGLVQVLAERGREPVGAEVHVASDVPLGSGLSSSAAFEVAVALALAHVGRLDLSPTDLARACQEAEHLATGVPTGIMDQFVSLTAEPRHASLIDCRSLTSLPVAVPDDLRALVVHSGLDRRLEDTPYAERRHAADEAAERLGVKVLRDLPPEPLPDDPVARHVMSENARAGACAFALAADARRTLADAFAASHASLRDDFGCSTPEIDDLVNRLVDAGAIGARLTGAGWDGFAALADARHVETIRDAVADLRSWTCRPATGAGPR